MSRNVTRINRDIITGNDYRTPEEMLEYLNGAVHFGSFFYTLKRIMAEKDLIAEDADRKTVIKKINELIKQNGMAFDNKNIRNWINGSHRPGTANSRDIIFLCFITGMDHEESREFLRKGCGRGGFNVHDPYEVLAAYCLANGYRYPDYLRLKDRFDRKDQEFGDYDESTEESIRSFEELTIPGKVSVDDLFENYLQPIGEKYRRQSHYKTDFYREYRMKAAEDFIYYGNVENFQGNYYTAWKKVHPGSVDRNLEKELKNDIFNNAGIEKLYNRFLDEIDEGKLNEDDHYTFLISLITPTVMYKEMFPNLFDEENNIKNNSESRLNDFILANFPSREKFGEIDTRSAVSIGKTDFRKGFILLHYIDAVLDFPYDSFSEWYDSLNNDLIHMQEMPLYEGDPFDFLVMYSIRRMMDNSSGKNTNWRLDDAGDDFLTNVIELSFSDAEN